MTCDPIRPTSQGLYDYLSGAFETNVLGGGKIRANSPESYVIANDYKVAEHLLSMTARMIKETDPRYACCDNLVDMASNVDGVHPRAATFAEGYVQLTGTPGAALVTGLQVNFGGALYRPANAAAVPLTMPAVGSVLLRFRAVVPGPGSSTPQSTTTGTLITPLVGIDRNVTVAGGTFCGGKAAEACEPFRSRYLARRRFKPKLNIALLEEAALDWPCVTRVCERGPLCCDAAPECETEACGTKPLLVHAIFDNTFENGIAPDSVLDEMTDEIFGTPQGEGRGKMPIGVCGRFVPITSCVVDVVYSGLACATAAQQELIRKRTAALFSGLCPSHELCANAFVGVVAQVTPNLCDFDVTMTPRTGNATVNACGDLEPDCDVLPVLGNVKMV